jgi:Co/Zn/Cd efflux system component
MAVATEPRASGCALCGSASIRALWVTWTLNSAFTMAQVFGSILSHSLALAGDTGTMVVDSVSYLINIGAEYVRIRGASERVTNLIDVAASGFSATSLAVVCALTTYESIRKIASVDASGSGSARLEDVDARIMFAFTAGNLAIDIGMLGSILLRKRGGWKGLLTCRCTVVVPSGTEVLIESVPTSDGSVAPAKQGEDINVFSALAHVLADTMRTVAEMATSIIIWADSSSKRRMHITSSRQHPCQARPAHTSLACRPVQSTATWLMQSERS